MAKYTIIHTCGHTSERQLVGKHSERESKIKWFGGQDCPQCWAAGTCVGDGNSRMMRGGEKGEEKMDNEKSWGPEIIRRLRGSKSIRQHGRATSAITAAIVDLTAARVALREQIGASQNRAAKQLCRAACKKFDAAMRAAGRHLGASAPLRP